LEIRHTDVLNLNNGDSGTGIAAFDEDAEAALAAKEQRRKSFVLYGNVRKCPGGVPIINTDKVGGATSDLVIRAIDGETVDVSSVATLYKNLSVDRRPVGQIGRVGANAGSGRRDHRPDTGFVQTNQVDVDADQDLLHVSAWTDVDCAAGRDHG